MRLYGTKNKTTITFKCKNCGKEFIGHRKIVKFCSRKCNNKDWADRHKEEIKKYRREYSNNYYHNPKNNEKLRKYNRVWSKKKIDKLKDEIFKKLGNKCNKCGISDKRLFQINHINGGGGREFRSKYQVGRSRGRRTYYKVVFEDRLGKYQLLCANCNWLKRLENNELDVLKKI